MGSLLQGFREGRRQKATLQTAEDRQNAARSEELAIERALGDVAAHRRALAQFFWNTRKDKSLSRLIPDTEFISSAVHNYRSVVLVKSFSRGWFHVEYVGEWRVSACNPVEVGERTYSFGYHLVPTP